MWLTKNVNFTIAPSLEEGVLLRASVVSSLQNFDSLMVMAEQQQAEIIDQAHNQAEKIIEAAHAQAKLLITTLVADREKDYLQRVEALFSDWQSAREQQETMLLDLAQQLISKTLQHFFEQSDDVQKTTALLRQLLHANVHEPDAILYCSPQQHEYVDSWLQAHSHLSWSLKIDNALKLDTLVLQTENGELSINWSHLQQSLSGVVKP